MREYVLLTVLLLVAFFYLRYLLMYPEDFSYFYYRTNYYKKDVTDE